MSHYQKQDRGESRKMQKRRRDDSALTNVVSLRISDQEKRVLEKITRSSSKNVSEIVREAIELWLAKRKKLCLDN
ncbi:transcriptional repressor, HgtR-related [Geotalea daltonii FRC-32]|uniref:Transcriptional repressor, HgtR-related n=1 Tax=Geotalea daltonii (strain DSM 22248 / JCM 15807 / FRC-32) TaxID=316067 RepID=B9M276_GEODF|nr:ribbon-helix-helix protein, CopG family [Geotalea daltonii]ACM21194.1 transcriptional repressor, HgtR-related [Geotalea daltonii FRC-32]